MSNALGTPPDATSLTWFFAYGTLQPSDERWPFLEPFVLDGGRPDTVHGRLYDTGRRYPAAIFGGDSLIIGRVFALRSETLERALRELDEVEAAVEGLYRRVVVTTRTGVTAWAYEFGSGLELTPIEDGNWARHLGNLADQQ